MITNILRNLGLNEKEIKVYRAILKARRITPAEVAKCTHINRTTVYAVSSSLVSKGLLMEDLSDTMRTLIPVGTEGLERLIKKDEKNLRQKEKLIRQIMEEVTLQNVGVEYSPPETRFIEEEKLLNHLYVRKSVWDKSALEHDKHQWGFQDHTFVENYREWIEWFWAEAPKELKIKFLSNQSEVERRLKGRHVNREIKFWNKGNFTATTWVSGDYLILINTNKHPFSLVEIYNPLLAHNFRELFKNLWPLV